MKLISLTRGRFASVDDGDFDRLNQWKWCLHISNDGKRMYAKRRSQGKILYMHNVILGGPPEVDHGDNDGLNNQRYNLRACSRSQNNANQRLSSKNTSGFKGVTWDKENSKWRAGGKINGRRTNLGRFSTKEEAHDAYSAWATATFREFARA